MNYKIVTAKENNETLWKKDYIKNYEVSIRQIMDDESEYEICVTHKDYAQHILNCLEASAELAVK